MDPIKWKMCPYNNAHVMPEKRYLRHIVLCEKKHPNSKLIRCLYDFGHLVKPEDMKKHYEECQTKLLYPDAIGHVKALREVSQSFNESLGNDNDELKWEDETESNSFPPSASEPPMDIYEDTNTEVARWLSSVRPTEPEEPKAYLTDHNVSVQYDDEPFVAYDVPARFYAKPVYKDINEQPFEDFIKTYFDNLPARLGEDDCNTSILSDLDECSTVSSVYPDDSASNVTANRRILRERQRRATKEHDQSEESSVASFYINKKLDNVHLNSHDDDISSTVSSAVTVSERSISSAVSSSERSNLIRSRADHLQHGSSTDTESFGTAAETSSISSSYNFKPRLEDARGTQNITRRPNYIHNPNLKNGFPVQSAQCSVANDSASSVCSEDAPGIQKIARRPNHIHNPNLKNRFPVQSAHLSVANDSASSACSEDARGTQNITRRPNHIHNPNLKNRFPVQSTQLSVANDSASSVCSEEAPGIQNIARRPNHIHNPKLKNRFPVQSAQLSVANDSASSACSDGPSNLIRCKTDVLKESLDSNTDTETSDSFCTAASDVSSSYNVKMTPLENKYKTNGWGIQNIPSPNVKNASLDQTDHCKNALNLRKNDHIGNIIKNASVRQSGNISLNDNNSAPVINSPISRAVVNGTMKAPVNLKYSEPQVAPSETGSQSSSKVLYMTRVPRRISKTNLPN